MTSTEISTLIVNTAAANGVDPRLALEVAMRESRLDNSARSSAGAIGIFQLEPATAADLGVDPTDPLQNIDGGVRYLAQLIAQFGDINQALGAYNWGMGNVQGAVDQYGSDWLSHAPAETQAYVSGILSNVGTQYTVSAGSLPSSQGTTVPGFNPQMPWQVLQAGLPTGGLPAAGSGMSIGTIALLLGLGFLGMMLFSD